jgi:Tfp pilus assembly protein FimT
MTVSADTTQKTRRTTYIVVGAVILVLLIVALIVFSSAKESQAAQQKADQLIAAINQAGLPAPTQDQVVRVLGDDGGAVCADPNSALNKAILYGQLTNGAAGPGIRPVIADNRVVRGELLVIGIYCPDQLPEFTKTANDLKLDDVVNG